MLFALTKKKVYIASSIITLLGSLLSLFLLFFEIKEYHRFYVKIYLYIDVKYLNILESFINFFLFTFIFVAGIVFVISLIMNKVKIAKILLAIYGVSLIAHSSLSILTMVLRFYPLWAIIIEITILLFLLSPLYLMSKIKVVYSSLEK